MDFSKCEMCGRPRVGIADLDVQWVPEYGVFLCKNCHKEVIRVNERLFGRYMSIKEVIDMPEGTRRFCYCCGEEVGRKVWAKWYFGPIDAYVCEYCSHKYPDLIKNLMNETEARLKEEEETVKVKVRRDSKEEIEVDVNDLRCGDEFDISKDGEVIATGIVTDTWGSNGVCKADVTLTFKKEGKTWKDLGYDCLEDMIDDIAKQHGSLGTRYKCCGCLNAADSYGESYVEIEQNGAKTIVHSDSVTIYPVHKEEEER